MVMPNSLSAVAKSSSVRVNLCSCSKKNNVAASGRAHLLDINQKWRHSTQLRIHVVSHPSRRKGSVGFADSAVLDLGKPIKLQHLNCTRSLSMTLYETVFHLRRIHAS